MELSKQEGQRAFAHRLRSGWWPTVRLADGTELKFNPYHDPRNGQFTFAPGGAGGGRDAKLAPGGQGPKMGRGGNSRAFEDPMTLEQTFPGLRGAPGGAIVAVANGFLDLTGPASDAQIALLDNWTQQVIRDIKAVDPNWRYDRLGPVNSVQGRINELNDLRFQRAAIVLKVKGDVGPLQVETLRFIQRSANRFYERGTTLLSAGRIKPRLSEREVLGNYIDAQVRRALRALYGQLDIDSAGKGPVRVNRRENDTSGSELTYRRPDTRVGDVAFDVTLTRKTLTTPQVRGFFNADFQPRSVVIIRPHQVGPEATYIISRPEVKR